MSISRSRTVHAIVFGVALSAAALAACTFTRSLDYLQNGEGSSGGGADTGADNASSGSSGSPDGTAAFDGFIKAQFDPKHVVLDSDTIYWSTGEDIMAASKSDGQPRKLGSVAKGTQVAWLAVDPGGNATPNGFVYVIAGREVSRLPKAGGEVTLVEKETVRPVMVVADDTNIFVAHFDENAAETGNVSRFTKDGMNRTQLSVEGDDPLAVVIEGSSVFWPGLDPVDSLGVVFELPKNAGPDAGGTAIEHRSGATGDFVPASQEGFGVDADAIYFFDGTAILKLARPGNPDAKVLLETRSGTDFVAFVLDATSIYVAELRAEGTVFQIPKMGGQPKTLAQNKGTSPTSIAVDDQYVYFTIEGTKLGSDGAIVRVAK